jgi:hypothetical protein
MDEHQMDEIAELADRMRAKQLRGEEPGMELAVDFFSLTGEEQDRYIMLMNERTAHGKERVEALEASNAAMKSLLRLQVRSDAPPDATLAEAIDAGHISWLEIIEAIDGGSYRLAEQAPPN